MCSLPIGMYTGQVRGTEFIKHDKVFTSDLQMRCMSLQKGTLGVERTYHHKLGCLERMWTQATAFLLVQVCRNKNLTDKMRN